MTMTPGERFHYLATNCIYLLSRKCKEGRSVLLACDDFYVELQYDSSGAALTNMSLFTDIERISKYLESIELNSLW